MLATWRRFFLTVASLLISSMAVHALDLSRLDSAETELESLVADWQAEWTQNPAPATARELAASLQALGMIERQAGKPDEALDHLNAACDLFRDHAPQSLPDAREALALTRQDLGDFKAAEDILRQVLDSRIEKSNATRLAATCDHLAMNLVLQGRYTEVPPLLDRAEAATPPDDADFRARIFSHRGKLAHTLGSHARAVSYFEQALALPIRDPELRLALRSQLALSQLRLGKIDLARAGTEAAADEARRIYINNHLAAVPYLNNLGAIALSQGDLEIARSTFAEALDMLVNSFDPDHPGLIGPLNNLGVAELEIGDYAAARIHLERAAAIQKKHLPPTHLRVAETERNLARNSLLAGDSDARDHVIRATAIGLDLLDRLIRDGTENERLNFLERLDLVSLPCAVGDPALIANVLLASKARLLDAMLASSASGPRATWQNVQAALAPGCAFIDTCRFTPIGDSRDPAYGAIVILPSGPPRWIPLGTDASLENWLSAFHDRLRWLSAHLAGEKTMPPALKLRTILRAFEREFWTPLQLPPEIRNVAWSPDSRLHFLPLCALLNPENRPLASRFLQITTVTSGRDLLNPPPSTQLTAAPWAILTISEFPTSPVPADAPRLDRLLASLGPMPGTRAEANKLRRIAPSHSIVLRDRSATEHALRNLNPPPAVLHLGCHAFFLPQENPDLGIAIDFDERADLFHAGGLVLYNGALRRSDSLEDPPHDDLLFPQEIASLPLRGTRLVTLSSCDSGAGTPVSGEGLLGLRRAFSLAGAREIVVALWPVADDSTPEFMDHFYRLAVASDHPAQALWQTQAHFLTTAADDAAFELAVLRHAPFVLSQDGPLGFGPPIEFPPASHRLWIPALATIPLLLFLAARFISKSRRRDGSELT
jgi:tetratricopeptide (TPR) repeat protein